MACSRRWSLGDDLRLSSSSRRRQERHPCDTSRRLPVTASTWRVTTFASTECSNSASRATAATDCESKPPWAHGQARTEGATLERHLQKRGFPVSAEEFARLGDLAALQEIVRRGSFVRCGATKWLMSAHGPGGGCRGCSSAAARASGATPGHLFRLRPAHRTGRFTRTRTRNYAAMARRITD